MAIHDRLSHETVVADLCGALLASPSSFPYYFLVAIEAGSFIRGILLLLLYPLILLISHYHSKSLATNIMIFISMGGLKVKDIKLVSRSVLPKFFVEDVREDAWSLFNMSCKRVVMTSCPTVMVESFARDYLGADKVVGRELEVHLPTGRATGFVKGLGFGKGFGFELADLWIAAASGEDTPLELKKLCKEVHLVHPYKAATKVQKSNLKKKLVFHDGRFVRRPTPWHVVAVLLWLPFGLLLFLLRSHLLLFLPTNLFIPLYGFLGFDVVVHGRRPPCQSPGSPGSIFAANHSNFMDAVVVSFALGRMVSTTSTLLGQYARLLSPLPLINLTRNREVDRGIMADHLRRSDFIIFPEGTTCREPYVLRFSKLFAELVGRIVPVAIKTDQSWLHGTSTRGWKGMDLLFLFSNPWVHFEVTFLEAMPEKLDVVGEEREAEEEAVANYVQKVVAEALGYEASRLSRKDKHKLLLESWSWPPAWIG